MNWLAVMIAAVFAAAVLHLVWRKSSPAEVWWIYLLQIVPAAMLGHALARIGPEKLAAKPHLYFMQSGGLALAIVIPALWMGLARRGVPAREVLRDSGAFLLAYLAMGTVFFALA